MSRIIKIVTGVRNNWKKTIFAGGVLAYGVSYGKKKYEIHQLMRKYCAEASKYGNAPQPMYTRFKTVLVVVNPMANKRSGLENYEEYCAPILHLSGMAVDILKTDSEGHARRFVEEVSTLPDAIIVAGGDGTVCEVITGLLRRPNSDRCPIGVVPVGRTNTIGTQLFGPTKISKLKDAECIAKSAMSIVQGKTETKDVMKIEIISQPDHNDLSTKNDTDETPSPISIAPPTKPVYAIGALDWGTFRDALNLRDKYWYFGSYRDYITFVFNAFNDNLTWKCKAKLTYSDPCLGCSNCFVKSQINTQRNNNGANGRWWSKFVPKFGLGQKTSIEPDYSKVKNPNCTNLTEIDVDPSDINIMSNRTNDSIPKLTVRYNHQELDGFSFITKSWQRVQTKIFEAERILNARTIKLIPEALSTDVNKERYFSIDNEAFEVKPIQISVVPHAIQMYIM